MFWLRITDNLLNFNPEEIDGAETVPWIFFH